MHFIEFSNGIALFNYSSITFEESLNELPTFLHEWGYLDLVHIVLGIEHLPVTADQALFFEWATSLFETVDHRPEPVRVAEDLE